VSRRRRATPGLPAILAFGLAVLAAGPVLATGPVAGQTPGDPGGDLDETEARLEAHLDSLLAEARAIPPRGRRERTDPVPTELDTVMVDGLRVIVPVDDVEKATPWARRTVAAFERRLGPIPAVPTPPTIWLDWHPLTTGNPSPRSLRVFRWTAGMIRQGVEGVAAQALVHELPRPVAHWLAGPLGPETAAYRELSAHPAPEVRACRGGDVDACAVALGLTPVDDASPTLTPAARRSFLHHLLRTRPGALERLLTMEAGPAGRGRAGERADVGEPAAGEPAVARGIEPGGPGSAPRVRALLERAAGSSLDPILAEWREAILADSPAGTPASVAGTSLLWILLLLALATRSTRWRAG
jgi:hypothetical protein